MSEKYIWLPTSTAPKDGREFLVRMPRCGNVVSLVSWTRIHNHWLCKGESIWLHDGDLWTDIPDFNNIGHASDCAMHNMPAMPNGECDCGALKYIEAKP